MAALRALHVVACHVHRRVDHVGGEDRIDRLLEAQRRVRAGR